MVTVLRKMYFLFFFVIYFFKLSSSATPLSTITPSEDYCWRDFDGKIPADALPAGSTTNGKPLYIGQVLYENKIIPGKVSEGDGKVYFEYFDKEYSSDQNAKILCSQNPDKFEWIPTRHTEVLNLLPGRILIRGGFEPNCSTYLGRINNYDNLNVGKVMCCKGADHCYGLYTTENGKGKLNGVFQILSYNVKSVDKFVKLNINVRNQPTVKEDPKSCKHISIALYTT